MRTCTAKSVLRRCHGRILPGERSRLHPTEEQRHRTYFRSRIRVSPFFHRILCRHVSISSPFSIDDDYVPKKGDLVSFKRMLMPPKNEKFMAVHIKLLHLAEGVKHESWEEAIEHDMEHRRPLHTPSIPSIHEQANQGDHGQQDVSSATHVD